MAQDIQQDQKEAREHIVRAQVYKIMAWGFVVGGVIVFIAFHKMFANGDVMVFLQKPMIIFIMLLPFLPSYLFAMMSKKRRRKANEILEHLEEVSGEMSRERTDLYKKEKLG